MSTPRRRWLFRRFPDSFWGDVLGALSVLAGAALGALLFNSFAGLLGAVVGAVLVVIGKGVRRGVRQRGARRPPTLDPDS
jgi:hypothetical protein